MFLNFIHRWFIEREGKIGGARNQTYDWNWFESYVSVLKNKAECKKKSFLGDQWRKETVEVKLNLTF